MPSNLAAYRRALVRPAALGLTALAVAAVSVGALAAPAQAAPPSNDNFVDAQTLSGSSDSASQSTIEATREPGEPEVRYGENTIWYSWTAPSAGSVSIDTVGSDFDTTLGVFTGDAVNALTTLAINDDYYGLQSWVSLDVTAGATYLIQVDGWNIGHVGSAQVHLELTPAPVTSPVPTGRPAVTGRAQVGQTLSTSQGVWESNNNAPTSYSYEWLRCSGEGCVPIAGADQATYQPTSDDVGARLRSRVTGANSAGGARTQSFSTRVVLPAAPVLVHRPVIAGLTRVGETVSTTDGDWDNDPTGFAYQWRACDGGSCSNIAGATGSTYLIDAADAGSRLRVRVFATNAGGTTRGNSAASSLVRP